MKTLLFDLYEAQPTESSKFHGGGEYIKAVFENLVKKYWGNYKIIVFYDKDKFLDQWIKNIICENHIKEYFIKSEKDIISIFKLEKIDTFYSGLPYYYKKDWFPKEVRIIGTIHGLRFLELPADKYAYLYSDGKLSLKERVRYIIRKTYQKRKYKEFLSCIELLDDLICVSEHTKFSILNFYPQFKEKEKHVFYTPQKKAELCRVKIDGEKSILIMGGDRWIKNCYREIQALEKLFSSGYLKDYKVVVVGGLSKAIQRKIKDLSRYDIKGYVDVEELEALYKNCDIFVYASLNEGFGMPPLEAMKYGTTCVVSGVCSLPEICGDAVYYVNPYDINEMSGRILNAAMIKIDKKEVIAQFNKIFKRQCADLDMLCDFIIN